MIADFIEWLGNRIPGDDEEYLVCSVAADDHGRWPWIDGGYERCPKCDGELHVHIPRGERWSLTWVLWRSRYFPHRIYQPAQDGKAAIRWWEWRRRKFFIRPWASDWNLDDAAREIEEEERRKA